MAETRSAEEVLAQHQRDMGPALGTIYNALWNDTAWLHAKWNEYRKLYGRSAERVDLLNQVARRFFRLLQDVLFEDTLLHLARLTDPPASFGKKNLSLRQLPPLVPNGQLAAELEALVAVAEDACVPARRWRNRRLAHRDLALALATTGDPLPGISRADVQRALGATSAVLNRLERHYWNSETRYGLFIAPANDADSLVRYLRSGLRAERRRLDRLREGKPLPDDLEPESDL